MKITIIPLLASYLITQTNAVAIAAPLTAPHGYGVDVLEWTIPTSKGDVVLKGSIEEVYAQLIEADPGYEAEMAKVDVKAREASARRSEGEVLVKRGDVHCWTSSLCEIYRIREGINYLNSIGGNPTLGPGPGRCSRVSCSWDSAIWWCNDNNFTKVLPGFFNIANAAQEILNACRFNNDVINVVSGQVFVGGARDWNVIVRYDHC